MGDFDQSAIDLFLPRRTLTPVDMPFEQAMRLVLTGAVINPVPNAKAGEKRPAKPKESGPDG